MKDQRDIDFEQSLRQTAQWADRQNRVLHRSSVRRTAARIGGVVFYIVIAALLLLASLLLVGRLSM